MSTLRNLTGAPSLKASTSGLEIRDLPEGKRSTFVNRIRTHTDGEVALSSSTFSHLGGPESKRRVSASSRFYNSNHSHHAAGEVMGPSFYQRRRQRHTIGRDHNLSPAIETTPSRDSECNSIPPHPPRPSSASPSPSPIGRLRKFRSSTWDATGLGGRLSPRIFGSNNMDSRDESLPFPEDSLYSQNTGVSMEPFDHDLNDYLSFSSSASDDEDEPKLIVKVDSAKAEQDAKIQQFEEQNKVFLANVETEGERKDGLCKNCKPSKPAIPSLFASSTGSMPSNKNVSFSTNVTDINDSDHDEEKRNSLAKRLSIINETSLLEHTDSNLSKIAVDDENDAQIYPRNNRRIAFSPYTDQPEQIQPLSPQSFQSAKSGSFFSELNPFKNMSWSLVGSYIVRTAPCFWCMKKIGVSSTDREILMRLNLICAFFCIVQIGAGAFLFFAMLIGTSKDTNEGLDSTTGESEASILVSPDLWNLSLFVYMLSLVNLVLLVASFFAQTAIREVNLVRSVRFMWSLLWLLPVQIFLMIGLFDYYRVMEVWLKHWWDSASMSYFRNVFCEDGTADAECTVPIQGGASYNSEDAWCLEKYGSTECTEIRNEAQTYCTVASYIFFTSNGVWALFLVALMWVTLSVLQAIITVPIVQRSKESNIPLWLTLPIVGCFGIGYILLYGPSNVTVSIQDVYWIGLTYLISGGSFALAALVGYFLQFYTVMNGREKKVKQGVVVFFLVTIVVTVFSVATIFAISLIYSLSIVDIPVESFHNIACYLDFGGSCSGCNSNIVAEICPEWSQDDVTRVLKTIMKQSATVAAIFLVYALITLRYGFLLFRHVSSYQIDYV